MRALALALAAAILAPAPARADAGDAELQPVVVVAPPSPPGEADRAPAAASTTIDVSGQAHEARSTPELIARTPSAVVHAYGGEGQLATVSLRGASSEQCLVMLDGVPLSGALSGTVDLSAIPPAFLDRIEVVRGVVGPLYGPGALGGAVNLVTRMPRPGPPELDAMLRGGSFGTGELRLSGTSSAGPGAALVAFDALSTQGDFPFRPPDASADLQRQNNEARQFAGLARYVVPVGTSRTLDVLVQLQHHERGLAGAIQSPSSVDHMSGSQLDATARLSQKLSWGTLELRGFGRDQSTAVSFDRQVAPAQLDAMGGGEARLRFRLGHHGLLLLAHAAGEQLRAADAKSYARPELALGVQDEWLLFDGALSLLPAIRVDRIEHFTGVSPQLALAYRPFDGLELRASVAQSFRAPTFSELYLDQGFTAPNPDLQPERAVQAELGAALDLGIWHLQAAGFGTEYQDLIQYELYPPFRAKPFNFGAAGIAGLEAELAVHPRKELELSVSYSRQWSADLLDDVRYYGHELPYHPHHAGTARIAWSGSRLTAHLDAHLQSSQFLSRTNTAELAGRVDTALGAAVRPFASQPIWLGLEVENALDERAQDLYGYPLPGRAVYALLRVAPSTEKP